MLHRVDRVRPREEPERLRELPVARPACSRCSRSSADASERSSSGRIRHFRTLLAADRTAVQRGRPARAPAPALRRGAGCRGTPAVAEARPAPPSLPGLSAATPISVATRGRTRVRICHRPIPARPPWPSGTGCRTARLRAIPLSGGKTAYIHPYTGVWVPSDMTTPVSAIPPSIATGAPVSRRRNTSAQTARASTVIPGKNASWNVTGRPQPTVQPPCRSQVPRQAWPRYSETFSSERTMCCSTATRRYGIDSGMTASTVKHSREREARHHLARVRNPDASADDHCNEDHEAREDDEVAGRIRHQRHPAGEPQRIPQLASRHQPVRGQQGKRQSVGVHRLEMRQPHQRVRVEREHRAGNERRDLVSRPLKHERVHPEQRQRPGRGAGAGC